LLAYREDPSFFAVGRRLGLHHQTAQRCVERAVAEGPIAALDDRPRPGREPTITLEAKAWLVWLACRKAKDFGYPHELWTTRLLASHARERGPVEGHACLANLAQGTVCKILAQEEVKPHKVRYYLECRDPDFAEKMANVLSVYREVKALKKAAAATKKPNNAVAVMSYDEKPGIQAIATTAPDLPPVPGATLQGMRTLLPFVLGAQPVRMVNLAAFYGSYGTWTRRQQTPQPFFNWFWWGDNDRRPPRPCRSRLSGVNATEGRAVPRASATALLLALLCSVSMPAAEEFQLSEVRTLDASRHREWASGS